MADKASLICGPLIPIEGWPFCDIVGGLAVQFSLLELPLEGKMRTRDNPDWRFLIASANRRQCHEGTLAWTSTVALSGRCSSIFGGVAVGIG